MRYSARMKHAILCIALAGCGKSAGQLPAKPSTGAPMAFEVTTVKPGDHHKGELQARAYNFSDKRIARYWVLVRYRDAKGAVIRLDKGTPHETDEDSASFSDPQMICEPASWCNLKIGYLDVPSEAVKAEVVAKELTALKDDIHFEDKPIFEIEGPHWPAEPKS
ncbi:MAG: hypothetical protein JWO36_839 [Myxococcales bacterium]|nr:hypothetical protein [Myxococcales bacterium]